MPDVESTPQEEQAGLDEIQPLCTACAEVAAATCFACAAALCLVHAYADPDDTTHAYCRACADARFGVCAICEQMPARACRECGRKVCSDHQRRVIGRWGWGAAAGMRVVDWFPMWQTYCPEHGQNRSDAPRPVVRNLAGYDGSSPEW